MKKLLFTAVSILSVCAMAADSGFVSGTTFTNKTSGTQFVIADEAGYWVDKLLDDVGQPTVQVEVEGVYTNRDDLANYSGSRPNQWAGEDEDNPVALQITDASVPLYRNIKDTSGEEVDLTDENQYWNLTSDTEGAITFDSLVLFTAADAAPSPDDEDKLVVWLLGEEEGDNPQTNLMITAGYNTSGSTVVSTNYVVSLKDVTVNAGEWYRLTISAEKDTVGGAPTAKFTVYVNGEQAKGIPEDGGAEVDTFPSRVADKLGSQVLGGVGFKGTGAVDDLTFTTVNPFVAPEQKYFSDGEAQYDTFAGAVEAGAETITLLADYDASQESDGTILLDAGEVTLNIGTYNISNSSDSGIAVEGGSLTIVGTGTISGDSVNGAVYVENATVVFGTSAGGVPVINGFISVGENATVKYFASTKPSIVLDGDGSPAWSDATDEAGYYTVVFGGGGEPVPVTGGGSVVVDSAEAAAAVTISAPTELTGKALETYQGYFTKNVSGPDGGKYTVTAVLNSDGTNALETATASATTGTVFNAVSTLLTGSDLSKSETVSGLEPGFYYSIDSGSALGTLTHPAGQLCSGSGSVTLTVKKFEGSGFYKVIASPTQIESTEPTEP